MGKARRHHSHSTSSLPLQCPPRPELSPGLRSPLVRALSPFHSHHNNQDLQSTDLEVLARLCEQKRRHIASLQPEIDCSQSFSD